MNTPAANLLKVILDKCRRASVSEVRFISGMIPAFVDTDGPHFLDLADLSRELVDEIHELCLSLADGEIAKSGPSTRYSFTLRHLGRIQCNYQRRGNVASLILLLDSEAEETVDAIRPKRSPSLRAEAKRNSKGKGH